MRPEEKLVCVLAKASLEPRDADVLRELCRNSIDWDYVLAFSQKHGVAAFVHHHRDAVPCWDAIPARVHDALRQIYYHNSLRNTLVSEQVKELLGRLQQENIPAIILKGIFLAEHVYGNIALKQISDIDLLVRPEYVCRVDRILVEAGFAQPPYFRDFFDRSERSPLNSLVYNNPAKRFFVHVHAHMVNCTWPLNYWVEQLDMERVWSAAAPLPGTNQRNWAVLPEHLVIYLSLHGFTHGFDRLSLFSDIAQTMRYYAAQIDGERLWQEAKRFQLEFIVWYSLWVTARMLGVEIPRHWGKIPAAYARLVPWVARGRGYAAHYLVYVYLQKGLRRKGRFLYDTFVPQRFVLAQNLGMPLSRITGWHYIRRIWENRGNVFLSG